MELYHDGSVQRVYLGHTAFVTQLVPLVNLLNISFIHYTYLLVIEKGSLNPIKLVISVPSSLLLTH